MYIKKEDFKHILNSSELYGTELGGEVLNMLSECELLNTEENRIRGKWGRDHSQHWVTPGGDPVYCCSECGKDRHVYGIEHQTNKKNFCSNCGAKNEYTY